MTRVDVGLIVVNSLVAGLLLVGGIGKLYSPDQLRRAVAQLTGRPRPWPSPIAVRLSASVEVGAGLALVFPDTRLFAAAVSGLLGLSFVALGAFGWARGASVACGCLGQAEGSPLGPANVALGVVIAGAAVVNLLVSAPSWSADARAASVTAAALSMLLLVLLLNRKLIAILLAARKAGTR